MTYLLRLLRYETCRDFQKTAIGLALLFLGILAQCLAFSHRANLLEPTLTLSLQDMLAYMTMGSPSYAFDLTHIPMLPISWMLFVLFIAFVLLRHASSSTHETSDRILILSQRRTLWWLSRCLWTYGFLALAFTTAVGAAVLALRVVGGNMAGPISNDALILMGLPDARAQISPFCPIVILAISFLALCFLGTMLDILTSLWGPIASFICIASYVMLGIFIEEPCFIGNFMMAARSEYLVEGGVSSLLGAQISSLLLVTSILAGSSLYTPLAILPREKSR